MRQRYLTFSLRRYRFDWIYYKKSTIMNPDNTAAIQTAKPGIRCAALFFLIILIIASGCKNKSDKHVPLVPAGSGGPGVSECPAADCRGQMRSFVQNISAYARTFDTGFIVIPQNGIELITDTGNADGALETDYISAISGTGQEDLLYGYSNDNAATPTAVTGYLTAFLDRLSAAGRSVLVIDYCSTHTKMDDSYSRNNAKGYISFAADHRGLDNIPAYPAAPYGENSSDITTLSGAKNFLYLINPQAFSTKALMLAAIQDTNYDVVLIDLYFNDGTALTSGDVNSLKTKKNGGDRLVICYMSIGEAENYRYYWQAGWRPGNPEWLSRQNPNWPGNYKVQYWNAEWQAIIYGNDSSYLKKIIDAGFDGVYLDIIDAFEYWE
jgi:cysteinyl-tRNA synthetase, unknown class